MNSVKKCSICAEEFPNTLEFFYKQKTRTDGTILLKARCKRCHKKTAQRSSKESRRKSALKTYHNNKEEINARRRKRYAEKKREEWLAKSNL